MEYPSRANMATAKTPEVALKCERQNSLSKVIQRVRTGSLSCHDSIRPALVGIAVPVVPTKLGLGERDCRSRVVR
jgi:hypothetical protein